MFGRRTDLPIARDSLGGFLPWLIALMVFLATLAVAGAEVLHQVASRWEQGGGATLSVQIPAGNDAGEDDRRVGRAVAVLDGMPGVASTRPVDDREVAALLEPWLGPAADSPALPLPRLIDVTLAAEAAITARDVQQRLSATLPGVTVDDHREWLDRVVRMMRAAELLAFGVLAMIAGACALTVVFTTRSGLAVHREAIEVMHLIGAQDSYIARQFAQRALGLGLRGGLLGLLIAAPVLAGAGLLGARLPDGMLPEVTLDPYRGALLLVPALAAAAIAMLTARITVSRTLGRMP